MNRSKTRVSTRGVHGDMPTFFRALCYQASQGGELGYQTPGYHLAIALGTETPIDVEDDEWAEEVEVLENLLKEDDDDAVWSWFESHYPKMMTLIPPRRRSQFVQGVRDADDEGRIGL